MAEAGKSNRLRRRMLAVGVLLVAAAVLLSLALDRGVPTVGSLQPAAVGGSCHSTGLIGESGESLTSKDVIRLNSNRFMRALVCAPSLIRLSAEGTVANGVGARLAISRGVEVLFDEPIVGEVDIEATVSDPGWLLIAFNNDYYEPPADRNLLISDLRVEPLTAPAAR